jgi:hypothetical protein
LLSNSSTVDLSAMVTSCRRTGSAGHRPALLCGGGVFEPQERVTYDSVAFRFIAANDHPDHGLNVALEHIERLRGGDVQERIAAIEQRRKTEMVSRTVTPDL